MTGRLSRQSELTAAERAAMFALLDKHFAGVSPGQFGDDISAKNWVVLVEDNGRLVGFSTLHVGSETAASEKLTVVYSGDTIISPEAWGAAIFPRAWISAVFGLRQFYPHGRFVWLLLTSGYRTYRLMPVFWKECYPRWNTPMPMHWRIVRDELAQRRFGRMYDPSTGIVRFPMPQRLRGALGDVPLARRRDPNVAFFLAANPGHADGDELVCITELNEANLTAAGRRVVFGTSR